MRAPFLQSPGGYYTDIFDGALNGVPDDLIGTLLGKGIGSPLPGYGPNDDGFGGPYPLGFSLNYFGNTYNSIYINNNGNISFGNGVGQFTPDPLNITSIAPMIAPYWADVDTRGTGTVAIRTDVPNQVIVTWDKVGYFKEHTDKLASFQLVLRGPDYPVPEDEGNIGFFYRNVGWETGDSSDGKNGFGGTQAAVGFGDGWASVNPGEFSLLGSRLPGISQLVSNHQFWFNLNSQGTIAGSSQDNPLLPDGVANPGTWVFNDAFSGSWVDPPMAFGFEYIMTSPNSLFTQILNFPTGIDADNLFNVFVGNQLLGQFSTGQSVDFISLLGGGVSSFTITGINPLVDADNPMAFPLQLAFNTPTASFKMRSLQNSSNSVPEPSCVFSLVTLGALSAGTGLSGKQRRTN